MQTWPVGVHFIRRAGESQKCVQRNVHARTSLLVSCMFVLRMSFTLLWLSLNHPVGFHVGVLSRHEEDTVFSLSLCTALWKPEPSPFMTFLLAPIMCWFSECVTGWQREREAAFRKRSTPLLLIPPPPISVFPYKERERGGPENKSPFLAPHVLPSTTVLAAGRRGPSEDQLAN